jgi:hypothetical protein
MPLALPLLMPLPLLMLMRGRFVGTWGSGSLADSGCCRQLPASCVSKISVHGKPYTS